MMKALLIVALAMPSPAGAEEVIHYNYNPMLDIQAFVDVEIKLANQDVLDMISRETAAVVACPKPATDEGGLFSNIEDITGEASNPPISTRLGKKEYAISKIKVEEGKFCYHLVSPVERILTLEEGRLLATALALRANPTIQNYYKNEDEDTAALNAKVDELFAAVKSKRNTDRLASKYGIFSLSDIDKEGSEKWTSCQDLKQDSEAVSAAFRNTGYIYNSLYSWKRVSLSNGSCYWLVLPIQRGLSADESKLLDAAINYGVTPPQSLIDNGFFPSEEEEAEPKNNPTQKSETPDAVTATSPLVNHGYPYSAIALVMQNGANVGTAFQVSPNVYVTAAHVVLTSDDRPKSGLRLHPKYRMPSTNNGLRIDVQNPQPYYSLASVQRTSNDYAFLRLNTAVPSESYMRFHMLDSSLNIGFTTDNYGCANYSFYDPYRFYWGTNSTNTYWNDVGCQWGGAIKNIAGYPAAPGGTSNVNNNPYTSTNIGLYGGQGSDGRFYKLVKRCLQCLPVIGMTRSNISYGFSGSPIIGLNPYVTNLSPAIVGIVAEMATSSGLVDGLASGFFDYNAGVFNSNINWAPTSLISISSPSEDGSYTSQNVPDLTANAGASTPQLVWRSDLDGLLGYGGNVSIAGRLRPGDHTITASIGSSVTVQSLPSSEDLSPSKRTAGAVIKTVHITITQPPSSTFNLTPATVLIPATQSQGKFTYNWSAPAYPSLKLQSSINGGAWAPSPPLAVPASATATDYISVGTNYVFRFMPNNDTNVLSTLSVQGVAAPSPVFSANPTTIVTNAASGNSTITWSAPGYAGLDWCGKLDSGPWLCGSLTTAPSGSTVVSIPVGSRYGYRFYPQGSPNQGGAYNLLGELFIQAVGTQQPTFSANPTHVIVPTGGTSGNTVITWSAPTYSGLDWCGRVDGGAWAGGLQTGPVGSTVQPVPVGTTYGYRFYPTGQSGTCGSQNLLGELTVYATH